jgi:DNA-binding response OmpR family regulator
MAKILLVDDDPITLKIVSFVLKAGGHQVNTASDGYTAVEMIYAGNYQMVISDVNMPGGFSGFKLATAVKENEATKHIPVVLLTVRSGKADVARARKCGADHYFIKPIQPDPFRAKINEILAKHTSAVKAGDVAVKEKGLWTTMFMVTAVHELGLKVDSVVPLPPGFEFVFASNVFQRIGISTPVMRVAACSVDPDNPEQYHLELEFSNLSLAHTQTLRIFLNKQKSAA